jgi:hypothetical protein
MTRKFVQHRYEDRLIYRTSLLMDYAQGLRIIIETLNTDKLSKRMAFPQLGNSYSLSSINQEYASEKILQVLHTFLFDWLSWVCLKAKTAFALFVNLLDNFFLIFIFAVKRKTGCQHIIQTDPSSPNINFESIPLLWIKLWRQVIWVSYNFKVFFFSFDHLAKSKIWKEKFVASDS